MSEEELEIESPEELEQEVEPEIEQEVEQEEVEAAEEQKEEKDESEEYGRRVQERINKLVAQRNAERDSHKRDLERLADIERKYNELRHASHNQAYEGLKSQQDDLKARMKKALDDADFDTYHNLNSEYTEVTVKLRMNESRKPEPVAEPAAEPVPQKQELPAAQRSWLVRNGAWYGKDNATTSKADELWYALQGEGYEADDPDTYVELDRRLEEQKPNKPGPTPPVRGGVPQKKVVNKLTDEDLKNMRTWGFDPENVAHRKAWLNEKIANRK